MHAKITLLFGRHDFEYDIYSLLKAFWPQAEITSGYLDTEEGEDTCRYPAGSEPQEQIFSEKDPAKKNDLAQKSEPWNDIPDAGTVCVLDFRRADPDPEKEMVIFRLIPENEEAAHVLKLSSADQICAEAEIILVWDRITVKNHVKELVYRTISEKTRMQLPWGDLTGIRPVKLMSGLIESGLGDDEAMQYMQRTWFVSPGKARLALQTARREESLMKDFPAKEGYSLYIGIPFCPTICLYCSFGSHPLNRWKKKTDLYLDVLEKELHAVKEMMQGRTPDTIYIGGGTPTSLSEQQLLRLMTFVSGTFVSDTLREFTVEAGRPDTITAEKLQILRQFPVDRISVNPQTMNQQTLDRIGRQHTVEETIAAFTRAREAGFDNINMDLIVGLPGEGEREVARTLGEIRKLGPDSLTVHSLALKRATRLHLFRDVYEDDSFTNSDRIMEMTEQCAADLGMTPYYLYRQKNIAGNFENVGYAREGKACLYNILIMEQRQTIIGAGSGASTKLILGGNRVERAENVKDLGQYFERIDEMLDRKRELLKLRTSS